MSHTRSISADFWTCEAVIYCTPVARLLFLGLRTFADGVGARPLRPRTIKMRGFPGDAIDAGTVRALIEELASRGLARPYCVAGQDCIVIVDWQHRQRVGKRAKRRYPAISEALQGLMPDTPTAGTIETHSNPLGVRSRCFETAATRPPQHEVRGGPEEGRENHSNPPPVSREDKWRSCETRPVGAPRGEVGAMCDSPAVLGKVRKSHCNPCALT